MMLKTTLSIPRMDCAAEERLVRVVLEGRSEIRRIDVDLTTRQVTVLHEGTAGDVRAALQPLNLGARLVETASASEHDTAAPPTRADEARTLKIVLAINAGMFCR